MAMRSAGWPGCGGSPDEWGEFLVRKGMISQVELDLGRESSADPLQWLFDQGILGERTYYTYRAMRKCQPYADLDKAHILFDVYALPFPRALELGALPIRKDGETLWVAFLDMDDDAAPETVASLTGCRVVPVVAPPSQIAAKLERYRRNPELWSREAASRDPGAMLILRESITAEDWAAAREASGDPIRWLLDADAIGEHEFAMARAWEHGIVYPGLSGSSLTNKVPETVPTATARRLGILPLGESDGVLRVGVSDPRDWDLIRRAERELGMKVEPLLVLRARDLAEALSAD